MGRRQIPVTGNGPVAQLALALRDLRESSGLTLRELAAQVGYAPSTLASAERGRMPPSWPVTDAFVSGCGAAAAQWRPLWTAAASAPADSAFGVPDERWAPAQLPSGTPGFAGRRQELAQLCAFARSVADGAYNPPLVCSVTGMAGVGKTALALQFAHLVAAQFPAGQLFVRAQGYCAQGAALDPREILVQLLRGLGHDVIPPLIGIDGLASLYRSLTAGKKLLIVLDNAQDVEQVRTAIPGTGPSLVVVTSRSSLTGLIVRDGAFQVALGGLPEDDALEVLTHIMTKEVVESDPPAASLVLELCGHLPLAFRIAAHHMTTRRYCSLASLAEALASDEECLDVLEVNGDDTASIRSVLSWSYERLSPDAARAFRAIGERLSPEFGLAQAASAIGGEPAGIRDLLRALIDVNMLEELDGCRYAAPRLVRLYAAEQARAERKTRLEAS
jgi:transcriptional regulator with XRE-family HTH domain